MDFTKIAIADVMVHPVHGVVSHQPDLTEHISDRIRVRDKNGSVHYVLASECVESTDEQWRAYWRDFNG